MPLGRIFKNWITLGGVPLDSTAPVSGATRIATDPTATWLTGTQVQADITQLAIEVAKKLGNVCIVDQVHGNDATGARSSFPFATITAALAAALAGDVVWVLPGTYEESITLPASVSVHGLDTQRCILQRTLVTSNTDLVTMGASTRLENLTMWLTSSEHHTLRGIVFGGSTSATAKVRNAVLTVDNSGAGAGSSDVTGVVSSGTGLAGQEFSAIRATTVIVNSTSSGTKAALRIPSGSSTFNARDCNFVTTRSGAAVGTYVGALCSAAMGRIELRQGSAQGPTGAGGSDVSQTSGTISLAGTILINRNADGLGFTVPITGGTVEVWGATGAPAAGATTFLRPGQSPASATEITATTPAPRMARSIAVNVTTGPGTGRPKDAVFTLLKNGAPTAMTVTLTGNDTSEVFVDASVGYDTGDTYAVRLVNDARSSLNDVRFTIGWY